MVVHAIQSNDNNNLSTVVKYSAIGAGFGYASKYLLPITTQEKQDKNYEKLHKLARQQSYNYKADVIQEIRDIANKSVAQDRFIKLVDAKNAKKSLTSRLRAEIVNLNKKNPIDAVELKNIIGKINEVGLHSTKAILSVYKTYIKHIRPTAPFIVAGGFTGLFAGVAKNVLKTETSVD